jgi:two-component system nitrogen regulation sensor histidine kinase NtrY
MRLAPRFVLWFGVLVSASTGAVGWKVREDHRKADTAAFDQEVRDDCRRAADDVRRRAADDRGVLTGACSQGELVDRTLIALEGGEDRSVMLGQLVPNERRSFGMDELMLVDGKGTVLAADPPALLRTTAREAAKQLAQSSTHFADPGDPSATFAQQASVVTRCRKDGAGGVSVGLLGARRVDPMLAHLATTMGVSVRRGSGARSTDALAQAECVIDDGKGGRIPIVVSKDTTAFRESLAEFDLRILEYCGVSVLVAFFLAILLARTLSNPISKLADEASKVARGEARPVKVTGTGEVAELTAAFDRMLEDLGATRRRLAATTRVAAWREVARRVAHEVKNPLAPIRAAVETLRRLRARDDPAFDGYFDEATRTVLDEVKRINDIVTEFTRFARLPPPKPKEVDLAAVARDVVKLHEPAAGDIVLRVEARDKPPLAGSAGGTARSLTVMADRDQIVQVLTNLVQNALDALKGAGREQGEVKIVLEALEGGRVAVGVRDDGPGVSEEMIPRLFEPYATSKEHGTGLGLAIAQRIAVEHGGELSYVPRPRGAEFRMVLPVEGPPPVSEMPPPSS